MNWRGSTPTTDSPLEPIPPSKEEPGGTTSSQVSSEPKKREVRLAYEQILRASFSGPIPPPKILKGYEDVFPGCAERIVAMAENQSRHRMGLEKSRIDTANRTEQCGQIFAFVIALAAITGGIYLISIGKDASGLTAIISSVGLLVGAFVYGKYAQAKEREQKLRPFQSPESNGQLGLPFDEESDGNRPATRL